MADGTLAPCHDDVIKWKHFSRYGPFVRGIHRSFDVFFDLQSTHSLGKINECLPAIMNVYDKLRYLSVAEKGV